MEWNIFEKEQKEICKKYNLEWNSVNENSMLAINDSLCLNIEPINGLRHNRNGNIEGWYIWSGDEIPHDEENFFKPIHIYHLIDSKPEILKYLGLPVGYRFQIDSKKYEDIWFDEKVANV